MNQTPHFLAGMAEPHIPFRPRPTHTYLPGYIPAGIPTHVADPLDHYLLTNLAASLDACREEKTPWRVRAALIAGTASAIEMRVRDEKVGQQVATAADRVLGS